MQSAVLCPPVWIDQVIIVVVSKCAWILVLALARGAIALTRCASTSEVLLTKPASVFLIAIGAKLTFWRVHAKQLRKMRIGRLGRFVTGATVKLAMVPAAECGSVTDRFQLGSDQLPLT